MKPYGMTNHIIVIAMLPQANAAAVTDILELGLPSLSNAGELSTMMLKSNDKSLVHDPSPCLSTTQVHPPPLLHFFSEFHFPHPLPEEVHLPSAKRHPALQKKRSG